MRYYLETNALYSIEKILKVDNCSCFTSILSLFELVSGTKIENFNTRKNILNKIINSNISIDWEMPEKIVFDSFNAANDYEFNDERVDALKKLIDEILYSDSFDDFANSKQFNSQTYSFEYFKNLDFSWNKGFIDATIKGNRRIKSELRESNRGFVLNGVVYELKDNKDLVNLFAYEPSLSRSVSIFAFCGMIKNRGIDKSEQEIYESYNGLIDNYIEIISEFCDNKMIMHGAPATNDFSDLTHLVYLRNFRDVTIVSDDKIFERYLKANYISIEKLTKLSN